MNGASIVDEDIETTFISPDSLKHRPNIVPIAVVAAHGNGFATSRIYSIGCCTESTSNFPRWRFSRSSCDVNPAAVTAQCNGDVLASAAAHR